jgi:hypothetical protein
MQPMDTAIECITRYDMPSQPAHKASRFLHGVVKWFHTERSKR